jgi:WhiB family redox-sensing transcriptional regulator
MWVAAGFVLLAFLTVISFPAADEWRDSALCAQVDPDAFFPEKGGSTRAAKEICTRCRVRIECLRFAIANDERFGVWGGLSDRERRHLGPRAR